MKFEYDKTGNRDCVAFIHKDGSMILKVEDPTKEKYCQILGSCHVDSEKWWNMWIRDTTRKFYRGDSVTITF